MLNMKKKDHQLHSLILVALLFLSPPIWIIFSDMPMSFLDEKSWLLVSIFCLIAYAVFIALTSHKDK